MNLPTTFDPIAYTREVENAAHAAGWTVRHLWPMEIGPRPWFQRVAPGGDRASPKLYLSAGIHGDEISGPLALLEMIRTRFLRRLRCDNVSDPQSEWPRARRADEPGRNRPQPGLPEHQVTRNQGPHRVTADSGRFHASMLLHEDYEGIGAYLYELNDTLDPGLGAKIIAAMGLHVPIDLRPEIEEAPAHGGVISRRDLVAKQVALKTFPRGPRRLI